MKFFKSTVAAAALVACAFSSSSVMANEVEPDTLVCRQPELILDDMMKALSLDATSYTASDKSEGGGDTALMTYVDKVVGDGNCVELAFGTSVVFHPRQNQTKCFGGFGCYIYGDVRALLPPEAGGKFMNGFAIRLAPEEEKEDLPPTLAALDKVPCETVVVEARTFTIDDGACQ